MKLNSVLTLLFIALFTACKGGAYDLSGYGLKPDTGENASPLIAKALQEIAAEVNSDTVRILLPKGRYDFYPEGASKREYFISNHDQDNPKLVGLAFENMKNVIFDGQGSELVFHGRMLPVSLVGSENCTLMNGISRSLFATADDELRPVMNGIYFDIHTDDLTFVASDGHKLVRLRNLSVKSPERASFILPKKPANLLKGLLSKEGEMVSIKFDDNNAYINCANFEMVCRLIEGRYPNYNSVIPQENPFKVTIDRISFLNALKRVSVFSNPASSLVKLQLKENEMLVSAQDIDFSTSAEEKIVCSFDGTELSIGFKATYLIEILSNINSEEVILELADPSRAGLIVPSENEENEDLLMLLMPMMLND